MFCRAFNYSTFILKFTSKIVLMRLCIVCLVIFLNQYSILLAQQAKPVPLILVDTFATDLKYLVLDADKIASVNVFKDSVATNLYGPGGKNGVVIIRTKEQINFLRLNALFDKYELPDSLRKLRICIDEILVTQPGLILADPAEVAGLSVINITDWDMFKSPVNEKVINIQRKHNNPGKPDSSN